MNYLNKTIDELQQTHRNGSALEQSLARYYLTCIQKKDHESLIKYIDDLDQLEEIKDDYELFTKMSVQELSEHYNKNLKTMPLKEIAACLYVTNTYKSGKPINLRFKIKLQKPDEWIDNDQIIENLDKEWIVHQVIKLVDTHLALSVSEWAEKKRYLPPQVTSMPGFYDYNVAPYLKEIADNLSVESSVREFDFMKGAQIGATVGILENAIGYVIDHVSDAPVMLLTADAELAKLRVESYITPMIQHSDLSGLIQSADKGNTRKTGKTDKRIEWVGGGFLVPYGARNADKLRSISIRYLLEDECDAFADVIGKDGDPQKLAEARTKAYHETRKIARISTPLIKQTSKIFKGFERGDQRKFFVPCKKCGEFQILEFQGKPENNNGQSFGLTWESDNGIVDYDTVRYICKHCGFAHRNSDKAYMLPRGKWQPTTKAQAPNHRSYHINALYSPVGMFPWEAVVSAWVEAWDIENNRAKNVGALQEFYNNVLGLPFEIKGAVIRFTQVSAHRRSIYRLGEIPNHYAAEYSNSHILFLTCTIDVHKSNLAVSVMGWCTDAICYVIDYWRFEVENDEKDCSEIDSPVWGRVRELIEEKVYIADDGKQYRIAITLIDAGYANDTVTQFCSDYVSNVYPILGRDRPAKNQTIKEFSEFQTQAGTTGYRILVDHYKDRMAPVLRREWLEDQGCQKAYHFNAPVDTTDKQLKELTVESRREKIDDKGYVSYYWHRPGNARNELWDLLGYAFAATEILAWQICTQHFELETVDWARFWEYVKSEALFYQ